jgi:eukaryotic-like serine/threonine-protein kinase
MICRMPTRPLCSCAVHHETEGNPLFVGEVVRLLAAEGRLGEPVDPASWRLAIPQGIREVIGRRVSRLSKERSRTLSLASVLGREFDLEPLEGLSSLASDELLEVLDEAAAARVVGEVPGSPGRLPFAHSLIRDTLYDELSPARRARLHLRAGEALESLYAQNRDPHLAELAHHFFQALPGGDVEKAIQYARRAADRAVALLAYEEAVRLYEMGLRARDFAVRPDDATRCDLLVSLADALARAGDMAAAKHVYLQAAQAARTAGLAEPLGRAAVGYGGRFVWPRAGTDLNMIPLLEEALRALPDEDSELRVRIMARLAGAMRDDPDREPRDHLSHQAVVMAERMGSAETLAYALMGRFAAMLGPDNGSERLLLAARMVRTAEAANDLELIFEGRLHRMLALLQTADRPSYLRELQEMERVAEELRQPAQLWLVQASRATRALLEGRFADAEMTIAEAA